MRVGRLSNLVTNCLDEWLSLYLYKAQNPAYRPSGATLLYSLRRGEHGLPCGTLRFVNKTR